MSRALTNVLAAARSPRFMLRLVVLAAVVIFLLRPLIPRVIAATEQLEAVNPWLTALGFALQVVALWCYSIMTHVALADERHELGTLRLFRIQLATGAVSSTVPGGAAAGPAVGYRLLARAGISGRNASAALASGSATSAFVLNLLLWVALVVSVPLYGFNAWYAAAALLGIVLMLTVAYGFVAIIVGSPIVERPVGFVARRIGANADDVTASIRSFGDQVESLVNDRPLVIRLSW